MVVILRSDDTGDDVNIKSLTKETKKAAKILYRLFDITLFFSKQNLTFLGHREDASSLNKKHFPKTIELLVSMILYQKNTLLNTG